MFFFSGDKIFTEQGLLKLANLKTDLEELKSRLEAYGANKENSESSSSVPVTWSDGTSDVDLSYNFIASVGGPSSPFSEKLLDDLIALVAELHNNNSKSYWKESQRFNQVEHFFSLFSDQMDNFSPDCFDLLSAEIAGMYLTVLDTMNINDDLTDGWILRAMSGFKNVRQLIDFVQKNTEYSLELFQLACRNTYLRAQDNQVLYGDEIERSELNQLIMGCREMLSFISQPDEKFRMSFLRTKEKYFDTSLSDEVNSQLSVAQVMECYNLLIMPHVLTCINRPYLNCVDLSSVFSSQKLTNVINDKKNAIQLSFCYDEDFYTHSSLFCVIALEAALYFPEYDKEEIKPQGFIETILRSSDDEKTSIFLGNFVNLVTEFRDRLSRYCVPSFTVLNRDAGKIKLATELLGFTSTLFNGTSETSSFIVEGMGQLLARLLRDHYKHQLICKNKCLSYGNFGTILSDTLLALCQLIKQYQYICDPYWKWSVLGTLSTYNKEKFEPIYQNFTYPSIENNSGNFTIVTRSFNGQIIPEANVLTSVMR